ncbi:iron complex transport system substrate-binding protein [Paenibacillus macquariensis]|uniref:Iron complex transport system substrate-binding protein n=2 Tax=Paenibacillus macquariensis TaxID=948756 RepID=A0ABY1KC12_9BACL|nr:iron complex transport system substrate-binding protein [Paenibacillus macquariensis]
MLSNGGEEIVNWEEYIQMWDNASIQLVDIRQLVISSRGTQQYLLPANGFIYVVQGQGTIWLDGSIHIFERFYLLHAGKGSSISFEVGQDEVTYYYILYRGSMSAKASKEILKVYHLNNPFQLHYACRPLAPVLLYRHVDSMYEEWNRRQILERFHVKILFYQFVYTLVQQLKLQGVASKETDMVEEIIQYIHEHFNVSISLESLAERWNYSIQYLSRQFKHRTGRSPIEYVIQARMAKAKELIIRTDATTQEIALSVGYSDGFYFARLFKKQVGMTPGQYKKKVKESLGGSDSPWQGFVSSMGKNASSCYIIDDNHYQLKTEGDRHMLKGTRSKIALTLMLCFTLILAACTNGNSSRNSNQGSAGGNSNHSAESVQNTSSNEAKENTGMRKISTVMGEVNVPEHPKRVVVDWDLGPVLAVGVTPVGASSTQMNFADFLKPYLPDTVQDIGLDGSISYEKVLDLSPDVIITWNKDAYVNYSKIAPTVVFDTSQYSTIPEEITAMGDILGRQDEAQKWIEDFEKRKEAARSKIKNVIPKDATISIVDYVTVDKFLMVIGNSGERGGRAAYDILGLNPTQKVKSEIIDKKEDRVEVSWETVNDYVGDYVIVLKVDGKEPPKLPVTWTSLNAVKNHHVIEIEMKKYFAADSFSSLLQAEDIADKITKLAVTAK